MQSHLYPCQQARPSSIMMSHQRPRSSSPLASPASSAPWGRKQVLNNPVDTKAGLCLPAALGKSRPWVLNPVQVSSVHTLWQKIGSTFGMSSVLSSRCGAGAGSQQQLVGWEYRLFRQEHELPLLQHWRQRCILPLFCPVLQGWAPQPFSNKGPSHFSGRKPRTSSHPSRTEWLGRRWGEAC